MGESVDRTRHDRGRRHRVPTLSQTFVFPIEVTPAAVCEVLRSAPLVGPDSIFGERPGEEPVRDASAATAGVPRRLLGFSPAPGFAFDVALTEPEPAVFVASFSQPDRATPYLDGDAVWLVGERAGGSGAQLDEEINTARAHAVGAETLTGPRSSLRRWLFFRVGHARVMREATARIAGLAAR